MGIRVIPAVLQTIAPGETVGTVTAVKESGLDASKMMRSGNLSGLRRMASGLHKEKRARK